MRGMFSGMAWGGLLSGAGLVGLSLLTPLSPPPEVVQLPPVLADVPTGSEPALPADQPGADRDVAQTSPAETAAPELDPLTTPRSDAARFAAPVIGPDPASPTRPAQPATRAVLPEPDATSLDGAPKAAIRPFPPPGEEADARADITPRRVPRVGDDIGDVEPVPVEAAPKIDAAQAPVSAQGPNGLDAPVADARPSAVADAPDLVRDPAEAAPQTARIAALPQAGPGGGEAAGRPSIGTPVAPLTRRGTSRGDGPDAGKSDPLQAFATPFEGSRDQPLMAIVLMDETGSVGGEALAEFPYPVAVAIDPTATGAAERAARHRAAELEVVALIDLPTAATAQDAEVLLSAGLERLPETVALIEGIRSGIQGSRDTARQVTDVARATGRGLITQPSGLNTVQKLALRGGVPSVVVFRDIDGDGQSPETIRTLLDRAAFRAGQNGSVVVLGRVRPDTISALALWGLQDRASRVTVAPVSAVLRHALEDR